MAAAIAVNHPQKGACWADFGVIRPMPMPLDGVCRVGSFSEARHVVLPMKGPYSTTSNSDSAVIPAVRSTADTVHSPGSSFRAATKSMFRTPSFAQ